MMSSRWPASRTGTAGRAGFFSSGWAMGGSLSFGVVGSAVVGRLGMRRPDCGPAVIVTLHTNSIATSKAAARDRAEPFVQIMTVCSSSSGMSGEALARVALDARAAGEIAFAPTAHALAVRAEGVKH